jgi:peptidyl-Asp metalloendopeptidase
MAGMRFTGSIRWVAAVTALAVCLLALLVGAGHLSQPTGGGAGAPGHNERLLTSDNPGDHGILNSLFKRLLSNPKWEKLSDTGSEVWTVPHSKLASLQAKLVSLGIKFTLLRDDWNHILRRNTTPMSPDQKEMFAKAGRSRETVGTALMRAPEAAVAEYALTESPEQGYSRIIIPFSDDQQINLVRTSATRTDKGVIWRGTVADTGETAILQWWKDGRLNGLFGYRGHIYSVMNMGGDLHAVLEVDPKMMPRDHPTMNSADVHHSDAPMRPLAEPVAPPAFPKVEPISPDQVKALEAKKVVIDVMMLYTKRAASHYMIKPEDVLELAFERVNDTFRNSGIENVSVRLVYTRAVDYDEQGSEEFVDLYRMVDGDGPFKDVRRLRDEKHADIVGLLVDDPRGCGLSTRVAPDAEEAYFVVHYSCAAITISIAHEIGHILGARHDRLTDANNTPFPYGHGYVDGSKWRDIMSYAESCDGCLRIPYWSNPRVLYKGEPTGTLTEDNARVILEQAERVSKFR